jgi:hypothetical protein
MSVLVVTVDIYPIHGRLSVRRGSGLCGAHPDVAVLADTVIGYDGPVVLVVAGPVAEDDVGARTVRSRPPGKVASTRPANAAGPVALAGVEAVLDHFSSSN